LFTNLLLFVPIYFNDVIDFNSVVSIYTLLFASAALPYGIAAGY